MGHFLERGDALYWEKEAKRLMRLFDKIERFSLNSTSTIIINKKGSSLYAQIESIRKQIRHFRKIFSEEKIT